MELTLDQALQKGIEAHKAGRAQEADRYYTAIIKANPKHPDANHNMGVLAVGFGKVETALPFFKTALEANPNIAQFWLSYIDALIKLERIAEAKAVFDQAKSAGARGDKFDEIEPQLYNSSVEFKNTTQEGIPNKPNILDELKLDQALKLAKKKSKIGLNGEAKLIYQDIIRKFPKNKIALDAIKSLDRKNFSDTASLQEPLQEQLKSILNLYTHGKYQEAETKTLQLLEQFPNSANLYNIFGAVNQRLGRLEEAVAAYKNAYAIKPDYADAYYNMGSALKDLGKVEEAIAVYKKAIYIKPDYADAYNNMGNALTDQGKVEEAIKAYKKGICIKPDCAKIYNNMGNALRNEGKLEKAIAAFKKACSLEPNLAETYNNLGVALKDQGKFEEAMEVYNKVISLKPDYADVYNNIGITLKDQGKLGKAIKAFEKAISLKPDHAESYYNMGIAFQDQSKIYEAIEAYNKAISIKPDFSRAFFNMGIALKGATLTRPNKVLQNTITQLLEKKVYVKPSDISHAAISLLKLDPILEKHLRFTDGGMVKEPLNVISDLNKLPLLLKLMRVCPLADQELEKLFKNLRAWLLSTILALKELPSELIGFQSALALQCFTNEYVYSETKNEEKNLLALEKIIKKALKNNAQPRSQEILALASYKALSNYDCLNSVVVTDDIQEVFTRQVYEPIQEEKLKKNFPILKEVHDKVSSKVREQYEENPYPRWVNLGLDSRPMSIAKVVNEIQIKVHDQKINEVKKPEILIAGCGTGQHAIGTAARFKSSKVLAIDLSLSSLAYAKRKTAELGIKNIEYMQADILDLLHLNKQFDIIESSGVLHHMKEPLKGWSVLTDCLRPGGLMKIGLYSELARQDVITLRAEIKQLGIGSSGAEMKSFRDMIIKSEEVNHKLIQRRFDFYSLSTLRDLLFHVQEYRFNIPLLKAHLSELGLQFCGFEANEVTSHFKKANTNHNDAFDLNKWQVFEEANQQAFTAMYQFWCQKVDLN